MYLSRSSLLICMQDVADRLPRFGKVSYSCNYVVSVRRGILSLLVLGIGCVILSWHPLGLPYNYCLPMLASKRLNERSR